MSRPRKTPAVDKHCPRCRGEGMHEGDGWRRCLTPSCSVGSWQQDSKDVVERHRPTRDHDRMLHHD